MRYRTFLNFFWLWFSVFLMVMAALTIAIAYHLFAPGGGGAAASPMVTTICASCKPTSTACGGCIAPTLPYPVLPPTPTPIVIRPTRTPVLTEPAITPVIPVGTVIIKPTAIATVNTPIGSGTGDSGGTILIGRMFRTWGVECAQHWLSIGPYRIRSYLICR